MNLRQVRALASKGTEARKGHCWLCFTLLGACILITLNVPSRMYPRLYHLHNGGVTDSGGCSGWFSLTRAVNRANGDAQEHCIMPELTDDNVRSCFQSRARERARPVRIALIGDSRSRVVLSALAGVFQVSWPEDQVRRSMVANLPEASPEEWCAMGFCSHHHTSNTVSIGLDWRPYLNRFALSALTNVTRSCGGRELHRRQCPDLLLVNSAMWYSTRCPTLETARGEILTLMYRLHVQQALPTLRRTSQLVPTYWMLEHPVFSDFAEDYSMGGRGKSLENLQQMVAQAIALELTAKIPEMRVWSSLLSVVGKAVYSTCSAPLPDDLLEQVPKNCVLNDSLHLKASFQRSLITPLLGEVCAGDY